MLLSEIEVKNRLKNLKDWEYKNNSLEKSVNFKNFISLMGMVTKIGLISEKFDHHPDILIYGWNNLKITISTHSVGGVTEKDFHLLENIEDLMNER